MKEKIAEVKVSEIYEMQNDPQRGKNLLGFFISFPDGRIKNIVEEFDTGNYPKILEKMKQRRRQELSRYNIGSIQYEEIEAANNSPP